MEELLKQLRHTWKQLLAKDKFADLFSSMTEHLNPESGQYNTYIVIRGKHSSIYQAETNGTLFSQEINTYSNQIRDQILKLIDTLVPEDIRMGGTLGEDLLNVLAGELEIQEVLTPLYLVNCDRKKPRRNFLNNKNRLDEAQRNFQFYYVLACPSQEPEGFTERMVYELAMDYEEQHQHSFHYRRRASERLSIDVLPLRTSLNSSKEAFKKYFAEHFNLGNTTFDEYLQKGLPRLQWECINLVFKIRTQDWDSELLEPYLQWLMDAFTGIHAQAPKFLFFFVISVKNAHEPNKVRRDDREILESMDALINRNVDHALLITNLPPVDTADFDVWLEDLCSPPEAKKLKIIQTIAERLPAEERQVYEVEKMLNMEHIEDFQERVYRHHT